jgi:hypothetical protein
VRSDRRRNAVPLHKVPVNATDFSVFRDTGMSFFLAIFRFEEVSARLICGLRRNGNRKGASGHRCSAPYGATHRFRSRIILSPAVNGERDKQLKRASVIWSTLLPGTIHANRPATEHHGLNAISGSVRGFGERRTTLHEDLRQIIVEVPKPRLFIYYPPRSAFQSPWRFSLGSEMKD